LESGDILSKRIKEKDYLKKDTLESPAYLIYRDEYRTLSCDAQMMYLFLLKRFGLSSYNQKKEFVDDEGNVFCVASNPALQYALNLSKGTVIKCKRELIDAGLIEEVKRPNKASRIYVNEVNMNSDDAKKFRKKLEEFRFETAKKLKESKKKKSGDPNLNSVGGQILYTSTKESFSTEEIKELKIVNKKESVDNPIQNSLFSFQDRINQAKKEHEQLKSICLKWAMNEHSRFGKAYWEKIINLFVDDLLGCNLDGSRKIDRVNNVEGYIRRSMANIANKKFLKADKQATLFKYTIESYNVHSTGFFFREVKEQFETEVVPDSWFDVFSEIFLANHLNWQVLNVLVEFTLTYTGDFKSEFVEPVIGQLIRKGVSTTEGAIHHFENYQSIYNLI